MSFKNLLQQALSLHQSGSLDEAEVIYTNIIRKDRDNPDALHLKGVLAFQRGRYRQAISLIERAVLINPADPVYLNNLGEALKGDGQFDKSITAYRAAIERSNDYTTAHINLSRVNESLQRFEESEKALRSAIESCPNNAEAHLELALFFVRRGKRMDAEQCFRKTLFIDPKNAMAHNGLGIILTELGRPEEAIVHYEKAIELSPENVAAIANMGNALQDLARITEACAAYERALSIAPNDAITLNNWGNALLWKGQADLALEKYQRAKELNPEYAEAYSNHIFASNYVESNEERVFQYHQEWAEQFRSKSNLRHVHRNQNPHRKLKIGYVSPDFRRHPVGYFIEPALVQHNRNHFDVYVYSNVISPDAMTDKFQSMVDHWRNIVGLNDDQAAELIQKDEIDILIDLAGHTSHNRLLVFARKPAPIQMTYLGYPNTSGLPEMDYRISDDIADLSSVAEPHGTEKLIFMKGGFLCYSPPSNAPLSRFPDAQDIVFGSFNQIAKMSDHTVFLWAEVLKQVPSSRLLLKARGFAEREIRELTTRRFVQQGVSPERLMFRAHTKSIQEHMQSYSDIHIALDSFPYHGTTTTCDALWMGVPVVVLAGKTHVSRVGVSILSRVGLDSLVARNEDDFVKIAVELAANRPRLIELRSQLRPVMERSPLCDQVRFVFELEMAYRNAWKHWCEINLS